MNFHLWVCSDPWGWVQKSKLRTPIQDPENICRAGPPWPPSPATTHHHPAAGWLGSLDTSTQDPGASAPDPWSDHVPLGKSRPCQWPKASFGTDIPAWGLVSWLFPGPSLQEMLQAGALEGTPSLLWGLRFLSFLQSSVLFTLALSAQQRVCPLLASQTGIPNGNVHAAPLQALPRSGSCILPPQPALACF